MKNMSMSDWQSLQARKEIQIISRIIKNKKTFNYVIIGEIYLLGLGVCLNNVFSNTDTINKIWIFISTVLVIIPIGVTVFNRLKLFHKIKVTKQVKDVQEMVDLFDNEICYYVMTAKNFFYGIDDSCSSENDEIKIFHLIESSYYLNKSISMLYLMKNNLRNIIDIDASDYINCNIKGFRFENLVTLISIIYNDIVKTGSYKMQSQSAIEYNKWFIRIFNDILYEYERVFGISIQIIQCGD